MNMHNPPSGIENLIEKITAGNARELLERIACPICWSEGTLVTFHEPNNNSFGVVCRGCDVRHPLQHTYGIMWLRQVKAKRSNDIKSVMNDCGFYCYGCGCDYETLRRAGIGMHVHHTKAFAEHGETYAKIPLCALCHELISAAQRHAKKLLIDDRQSPNPQPQTKE